MSRSNLADAVSAVDRCSVDELRQLQALISVRIGEGASAGKARGRPVGQKVDGGKGVKDSKTQRKPRKGNPQKKSQYATHPVYKAYRDAKCAAERKAKEDKVLFKDLAGKAREDYDEALSNWLQTKSGFRSSSRKTETPDSQSEEDQLVERSGSEDSLPDDQSSTGASRPPAPKKRKRSKREPVAPSPTEGKFALPPPRWVADGQDWSSLTRKERRRAWKELGASTDAHMGERA
jgi:hypothetical protein